MTATRYTREDLATIYMPIGRMLQIDRVAEVDGEHIVCEMDVGSGHWVFPLHFPGDPIFPGSLLIEAAGQVVAIWGWHSGLRGKPRLARVSAAFERPVLPHDLHLTLRATVRRRGRICVGAVEIAASGRRVATVEPVIAIVPDVGHAERASRHGLPAAAL